MYPTRARVQFRLCVLEPLKVVITNWDQGELLLNSLAPETRKSGSGPHFWDSISTRNFSSTSFKVEAFATRWSCSVTIWFHHGCDDWCMAKMENIKLSARIFLSLKRTGRSGLKPKGVIHWYRVWSTAN